MLTQKLFSSVSRFFSPKLTPGTPVWYRARLTMFTSGVALLFYFFPELIFHLITPLDPISFSEALIILGGTASLLSGSLLARMGRVLPAIWFTVGGWTLDVLLDSLMGEGMRLGASLEIWLIFGLLIAFILLSFRQFVFFATAQTLLAWLAIWLWQRDSLDITSNMEIHLATVFLLGAGLWLREREQLQREEMALALRKQKEYLQEIVDSIQSPFYVVDVKDYRIRLANRAARATGLIEGATTCYALTHRRTEPCSGEEHPCPLQHVRNERRPYTTEHIHYRADGSTFYAEVHGYPLFDENGHVVQMVEHALDITERKRAEAEIRKLLQAVEHAASGVVITDPNGIIEYVNPTFERMTGYRRKEVIGQTPRLLKSGKNPPELYTELWRTILGGRVWQGELVNRRKDGSLYWEFQTIAPVMVNGRIANFVGIKIDITRQKELEQQLIEAKEAAEVASAFKSRLLANVSHDMRTPLGAILGYAELLRDGTYGPVNEQQQQILEMITRHVHRLTSFVSGMLIRAELESGKLRLQKRFFAPPELLKAVYPYQVLAEGKGLVFEQTIDPSLSAQLYGDPYWLEQILTNLVDNAIKYTDSGRIQVCLKRVDEAHWSIQVQDSGIGIPLEKQKQIFEPFHQVADISDARRSGAGLGLSIVKELAERLGGKIHLESSPGSGSTFSVILPFERFPNVS
ncbi:MAG: PAS domain S-box protein [Anaerolineales bacterium]